MVTAVGSCRPVLLACDFESHRTKGLARPTLLHLSSPLHL